MRHTATRLSFYEHDSEIRAIPQGADQVRSYVYSGLLVDEAAFQDQFQEAYAAMLPTIEGGGRLTLVSSANPSFYEDLIKDKVGG